MASTANYFPSVEVRVATDADGLKKLSDWFGVTLETDGGKDGTTWFLKKAGEDPVAIVWLGIGKDDRGFYPIVAHEAWHVAAGYFDWLGEDEPGEEFAAYTVSSVVAAILEQVG